MFFPQECELNLENLLKQEVEFDEDFTIPPQSYGKKKNLNKIFESNQDDKKIKFFSQNLLKNQASK
jgi:hypothetical protein